MKAAVFRELLFWSCVAWLAQASGICSGQYNCYIDQWGNKICPQEQQDAIGWAPASPGTRYVQDVPAPDMQAGAIPMPPRCVVVASSGSRGSGTLVSEVVVITNWHVVRDSDGAAEMRFPNGVVASGTVIATDPAYDLAAIQLRTPPGIAPITINDSDQATGTVLIAGGFGEGPYRAVKGSIVGWVQYDANDQLTPCPVMSGTVRPGDSGGAVINEAKEMVGVLWGARDNQICLTCGKPFRDFLNRVIPGRRAYVITPTPSSATQPVPAAPPPVEATPPPAVEPSARIQPSQPTTPPIADKPSVLPAIPGIVGDALPAAGAALKYGPLIAGALGVGGPVGIGVALAGWFIGRRIKSKVVERVHEVVTQPAPQQSHQPDGQFVPIHRTNVVTTEAPPPPQVVIPTTQFAYVEGDKFARADDKAMTEYARKYPGALTTLLSFQGMRRQFLNAMN